jgi:hypothetical protein
MFFIQSQTPVAKHLGSSKSTPKQAGIFSTNGSNPTQTNDSTFRCLSTKAARKPLENIVSLPLQLTKNKNEPSNAPGPSTTNTDPATTKNQSFKL